MRFLERLPRGDYFILDEELGGALLGAADGGKQAGHLLAGDQTQGAAGRAGEDGPVGILLFANLARIFKNEYGARFHLFGNPLVDNTQFTDHHASGLRL